MTSSKPANGRSRSMYAYHETSQLVDSRVQGFAPDLTGSILKILASGHLLAGSKAWTTLILRHSKTYLS